MEPDDLLCSRNARPQKALVGRAQWKISQPPSLERKRASLEGSSIPLDARSEGQPRPPRFKENSFQALRAGVSRARATRGLRRPSLNTRSGRPFSPP
jgi:hypothetical protein